MNTSTAVPVVHRRVGATVAAASLCMLFFGLAGVRGKITSLSSAGSIQGLLGEHTWLRNWEWILWGWAPVWAFQLFLLGILIYSGRTTIVRSFFLIVVCSIVPFSFVGIAPVIEEIYPVFFAGVGITNCALALTSVTFVMLLASKETLAPRLMLALGYVYLITAAWIQCGTYTTPGGLVEQAVTSANRGVAVDILYKGQATWLLGWAFVFLGHLATWRAARAKRP